MHRYLLFSLLFVFAIASGADPATAPESESRASKEEKITLFYHNPSLASATPYSSDKPAEDPFETDNPFGGGSSTLGDAPLQTLFERYGVLFPEGTFLKQAPILGGLLVRNTRENHGRLQSLLSKSGVDWKQIQIDVWTVVFDSEEIEKKERKKGSALSGEEIHTLWKEGHGDVSFSLGIKGVNGVQSELRIFESEEGNDTPGVLKITPTAGTMDHLVYLSIQIESTHPALGNLSTTLVSENGPPILVSYRSLAESDQRAYLFLSTRLIHTRPVPFRPLNASENGTGWWPADEK